MSFLKLMSTVNAPILQRILASQKNSHRITLTDNFIGDVGLEILVPFLKENPHITTLELKGNNISPKGFAFLCDELKSTKKLKSLICEWNNIGLDEEGVKALRTLLQYNRNLLHVNLRNNKLGIPEAAIISDIIKHSTSLLSLDLRWNDIRNKGAELILAALKENFTILYLEIQGNNISGDLQQEIQYYLDRNRANNPISFEEILTLPNENIKQVHPQALKEKDLNNIMGNKHTEQNALLNRLEQSLENEKKATLEAMERVDDEFQQLQFKDQDDRSFLKDLNSKIQKLEIENYAIKLRVKLMRRDLEDLQLGCSKSLKLQEDRFLREKKGIEEWEKKQQSFISKQQDLHNKTLREINDEWEDRCNLLESRIKDIKAVIESLESEEKDVISNLQEKELKINETAQMLHYKTKEEIEFFQAFRLRELDEEIVLNRLELLSLIERNGLLSNHIKLLEENPPMEIFSMEEEQQNLTQEHEVFFQRQQDFVLFLDKLKLDLQVKESRKEKIAEELKDFIEKCEKEKDHLKKERKKEKEKMEHEQKHWKKEKEKLLEKINELETQFSEENKIKNQLMNGKEKLLHALEGKITKTVYELFSNNQYI